MRKRAVFVVSRKLSDVPDSGLSSPGLPEARIALVATLTAEAWVLAGLGTPEYTRAETPISVRSLRSKPPVQGR
jgi:hypothetical protein